MTAMTDRFVGESTLRAGDQEMEQMTTEPSTERGALSAFCRTMGITASVERISREAFMLAAPASDLAGEKPQRDRTYWTVTLHRDGADDFTIPYSTGSAAWWTVKGTVRHRREGDANAARCRQCFEAWPCAATIRSPHPDAQPAPPEAADVLDSMAMDASTCVNARDFADWCSEYGYDTDSRKAERIYNVIAEDTRRLRRFLPADAFERLLWNTERL